MHIVVLELLNEDYLCAIRFQIQYNKKFLLSSCKFSFSKSIFCNQKASKYTVTFLHAGLSQGHVWERLLVSGVMVLPEFRVTL